MWWKISLLATHCLGVACSFHLQIHLTQGLYNVNLVFRCNLLSKLGEYFG